MITGGNATGIDADASITLRNSSSASGWPLLAISPMFQTTKRGTSSCQTTEPILKMSRVRVLV